MKKMKLTGIGCMVAATVFSQVLFTYGTDQVSKDEFISAFGSKNKQLAGKAPSVKEYLDLYTAFKLKVKGAIAQQLDTLTLLKYDFINFRHRLANDYAVNIDEAVNKTRYKRNKLVKDDELFRFADSVTLIPGNRQYAFENKVIFSLATTAVKAGEWLSFVKDYKLDYHLYKGETNQQLLDSFINKSITAFYKAHLEDYDSSFKYQLQLFKEGNLVYEAMKRNVWDKSTSDIEVLKKYYEANKDHFLWNESADVILVNARYYAYAAYASENMQQGKDWQQIALNSEGMILADSGRYELAQLPLKPGVALVEGTITAIVKNEGDNGAGFVSIKKMYPAKQQRNFEEAKNMVIAEYQKQLEENWMKNLTKKYPVNINEGVVKMLIEQ